MNAQVAGAGRSSFDSSKPMIGIVAALHLEISPFLERCQQFRSHTGNGLAYHACEIENCQICIVEGATGESRAQQAAHGILDGFDPDWVLSVGFSGALTEQLKVGDIVVGTGLTDASGEQLLSTGIQMESDAHARVYVGRLCTTDHIVREVSEKEKLYERTGALAVDMESLTVARVCRERHYSCMVVRVISDDLSSDLPPEVLALFGPKGTIRAGALVGALVKRPGCIKDLWRLRENAVDASERLAEFLQQFIQQLGERHS